MAPVTGTAGEVKIAFFKYELLYMTKIVFFLTYLPKQHFLMDANQNVLTVLTNLCLGYSGSVCVSVCICVLV